jgi:hypothetical protein
MIYLLDTNVWIAVLFRAMPNGSIETISGAGVQYDVAVRAARN